MNRNLLFVSMAALMLITACQSESIDEISKSQSANNEKTLSRSGVVESPLYFGRKSYNFEDICWIHNDSMSIQIIPFEAEYIVKAKAMGESTIYDCSQFRIRLTNFSQKNYNDFFVTLISEKTGIQWETLHNSSDHEHYTGYEIFTNVSSNRVVAVNYYKDGVIINSASLYRKSKTHEENIDEIEDILYGLGVVKIAKSLFYENDPYTDFIFNYSISLLSEHEEDCSYTEEDKRFQSMYEKWKCLWTWVDPEDPEYADKGTPGEDEDCGDGN